MNANYIYKIFETAEKHNTDNVMALEILRGTEPIPEGLNKNDINSFIGLHYNVLWRAYQTHHPKLFADIVRVCVESNEEEAEMLLRAYATGNEKLIGETETKYGDI